MNPEEAKQMPPDFWTCEKPVTATCCFSPWSFRESVEALTMTLKGHLLDFEQRG